MPFRELFDRLLHSLSRRFQGVAEESGVPTEPISVNPPAPLLTRDSNLAMRTLCRCMLFPRQTSSRAPAPERIEVVEKGDNIESRAAGSIGRIILQEHAGRCHRFRTALQAELDVARRHSRSRHPKLLCPERFPRSSKFGD